ncbi:hypothetical protein OBBRIDRAFT_805071 [Obba rivulosa]|uniref:Uncharacterized protein n=1 Tax=Obba rivulosa TaxID=1052685 RepID=A0A8E2DI43_9APHY|nr:hypothetical protein OBBRIDRAFT_805071 [Obba rivulosa]
MAMVSPIPSHLIQTLIVPTCGALFLSVPLASLFHGVTITQTYRYFSWYPDERTYVKLYVALLLILDTAHLVFHVNSAGRHLILNHRSTAAIEIIPLFVRTQIVLGFLVQWYNNVLAPVPSWSIPPAHAFSGASGYIGDIWVARA